MRMLMNSFVVATAAAAMVLSAPLHAQPTSMSYQGQLMDQGLPFNGQAAFKFVIVSGTTSLWSNDGTSTNGSQPTAAVNIGVSQGLFSVLLGTAPMVPITANLLSGSDLASLRMWVNTGSGFDQLPDQPLASSPYALHTDSAERALGPFTASGLIHSTAGGFRFPDGSTQTTAASGTGQGNTLDQAYDQGGPGAGRTINATAGAVAIEGPDGLYVAADMRGANSYILGNSGAGNQVIYASPGVNKALHLRQDGSSSYISNKANFVGNGTLPGGLLHLNGSSGLRFMVGDQGAAGTTIMDVTPTGKVGIGTFGANDGDLGRLTVLADGASALAGTAHSSTIVTSAGVLGLAGGSTLKLASFGFWSGNHSSLGIMGYRTSNGASWNTTAIGLGIDVDNTSFAGGASVWLNANGNVGIRTQFPGAELDVVGRTRTQVLEITGGADLSEHFDISAEGGSTPAGSKVEPGSVVCINPDRPGELEVASRAYDRRVAGVVSGAGDVKPGLLLGQSGSIADGAQPVALSGRVYCRVDASYGAITAGDFLTTSPTAGHAMRASDPDRMSGAVIGKAMTSLASGQGLVLVLVTLQ